MVVFVVILFIAAYIGLGYYLHAREEKHNKREREIEREWDIQRGKNHSNIVRFLQDVGHTKILLEAVYTSFCNDGCTRNNIQGLVDQLGYSSYDPIYTVLNTDYSVPKVAWQQAALKHGFKYLTSASAENLLTCVRNGDIRQMLNYCDIVLDAFNT